MTNDQGPMASLSYRIYCDLSNLTVPPVSYNLPPAFCPE